MDAQAIIAALGGREAVAAATASKPNTVIYWERRGRIPASHWEPLIELASKRDRCGVTLSVLAAHLNRPRIGKDGQRAVVAA
jgi:hypothetical protein